MTLTLSQNEVNDFALIDSRTVDKKHRINLGAKVFAIYEKMTIPDEFDVLINSKGEVLLRPKMRIPAHEKWLVDNPERLEQFQKGIQNVIEGKVKKVDDLDAFLESL